MSETIKKIEKLTDEQEKALTRYAEMGIAEGLSCRPISIEETREIIHLVQTKLLDREATPVILAKNPREAWALVCKFQAVDGPITEDQVAGLIETLPEIKTPYVAPWLQGAADSGRLTYYEFWLKEVGIKLEDDLREKLEIWIRTRDLGAIFPLDNICIVVQKPNAIHRNEHGLHNETGPAIDYDGWGLYSLNGVRVPEYLVMTPSEDLDLNWYQKQENADVKAEFVRKFGVERMLEQGKKIDTYENYNEEWWTKSEYELWDMACLFPNLDYQPYLKMLNQTTGIWHVEAVSPACRTIGAALKERFGGRDLTIATIS